MKVARLFLALFNKPSVTRNKPFHGLYKGRELQKCPEKYCKLCKQQGLIAHVTSKPPAALAHILPPATGYIDSYWCPNCNNPLLPSETSGEPI